MAAGQQNPQQGTLSFSLAPSRALDRVRNPRWRAEIFTRTSREFQRLMLAAERLEIVFRHQAPAAQALLKEAA